MNRLLIIILFKQTSPGYSYREYEFDRRKSSAESRVRCFVHQSLCVLRLTIIRWKENVFTKCNKISRMNGLFG